MKFLIIVINITFESYKNKRTNMFGGELLRENNGRVTRVPSKHIQAIYPTKTDIFRFEEYE